jgi:hypothetical protein
MRSTSPPVVPPTYAAAASIEIRPRETSVPKARIIQSIQLLTHVKRRSRVVKRDAVLIRSSVAAHPISPIHTLGISNNSFIARLHHSVVFQSACEPRRTS